MREQVNGSWRIETHPKAEAGNVLQGDRWRISVLTEGLIRLEYQPEGCFEDRATQMVWNRDFPPTGFQVQELPPNRFSGAGNGCGPGNFHF